MEALGSGIGFVGFGIFVASLIAIFRPIPSLWLPNRKRAALVCLGSLFLIGVGGSMMPGTPVATASGSVSAPAHVDVERAEKAVRPVASPAAMPVDQKAVFISFYHEFESAFDRCNNAFDPIAREAGSSSPSPQRLYSVSSRAKEICRNASTEVGRLRPPDTLDRDLRKELGKVMDVCQNAVVAQQIAADAAMRAIDDGFRPSRVQAMSDAGDHALQQKMGCVAGWLIQARALGVDDELMEG